MEVTVVIPAFNEASSIGAVVAETKRLYPEFEIIVIDDGSPDETGAVAAQAGAIVYSHPYNIGNGAAVKSGIRYANGEVIVFMDGDGQHDPANISKLLAHIPEYDMVVGARSMKDQASMGRLFGNKVFNWLASYVANFNVKDLTSGFRAVKAPIAKSFIFLLPNTYSYPTTITLGVLKSGQSIKYVSVPIQQRHSGKSGVRIFKDGVRFLMMISRICTLYSPMRIFLPVSAILFGLGCLNYLFTYVTQGRFTNMSALLFTTSLLVFMMSLISEQICQMRFERRSGIRARKRSTAE